MSSARLCGITVLSLTALAPFAGLCDDRSVRHFHLLEHEFRPSFLFPPAQPAGQQGVFYLEAEEGPQTEVETATVDEGGFHLSVVVSLALRVNWL